MTVEEIWLPAVGYEGYYEVSNMGNVRSLGRITNFGNQKKLVKGRVLKIKMRKAGYYPAAMFSVDNVITTVMIHRVVAQAFHPNPENKRTVNHIDGNKKNNRADNLQWATTSENNLHAHDTGLMNIRKLTVEQVKEIRQSSLTDIQLGKLYGVRQGNIWNIRQRKSWKHVL